MGTGALIVLLYPYRVFILHLAILSLIVLVAVVWLVVVLKVRRRIRARREQERALHPACTPRVHDDAPSEHPIRRSNEYAPLSPLAAFHYTPDTDFEYLYDDRNSKRASERLDPDQRPRF
jgi:flagellar biosynthesis/type III secretory pathway M-ring protein FliF/YscJ